MEKLLPHFEHSKTSGCYPAKPQGITKKCFIHILFSFSNVLCNRQLVSEGLLFHAPVKHRDAYPFPKHRKKRG